MTTTMTSSGKTMMKSSVQTSLSEVLIEVQLLVVFWGCMLLFKKSLSDVSLRAKSRQDFFLPHFRSLDSWGFCCCAYALVVLCGFDYNFDCDCQECSVSQIEKKWLFPRVGCLFVVGCQACLPWVALNSFLRRCLSFLFACMSISYKKDVCRYTDTRWVMNCVFMSVLL